MQILDPNNPSTWRNAPGPRLDQSFHDALAAMGCRIVWGQERMKFQRGKMRLAYVDRRIPSIEHTQHVLKRPSLLDDSGKAISWEKQIVKEFPAVIPQGWLAEVELVELEFIGDQLFYIEQFIPADKLGETPESWEAIRYEDWEDPEIGFVQHCDVLGPFPSEGQWRDVFAVGEPYVYPAFTDEGEPYEGEYLRFRMPGADTLEALKEKMYYRENEKLASTEQRSADRFHNYNQNKERQFDKYRTERRAWFHDALNTTGKREALARRTERVIGAPASVSVPSEFERRSNIPQAQLGRELVHLNRHQRRAQAKLRKAA